MLSGRFYVRFAGAQRNYLLTVTEELQKDVKSSQVDRPYVSQPATTAVQIALVSLLHSWNVTPMAVVGHSSGEIAAAYATGALSARSCMLIAYKRGVLAESLKLKSPERPGRMLAVGAPADKIRPMMKRLGSAQVVVACLNGPSLITASGDERGISRLQNVVEEENLLNRRLKVDVAYHSPHMYDVADEYHESIKTIEPQEIHDITFHSSVEGSRIPTGRLTPDYWVANMTSPVQFVDDVQSMYMERQTPDVLLEIGPHSTLESSIRDIMKNNQRNPSTVRYLQTLKRGKNASESMMTTASALFVLGCPINSTAVNRFVSPLPDLLTDLPTYPWNHDKRHWHESRISANHRLRPFPRSDLLGSLVDNYNELEPRWRNILRVSDIPWLTDHKVQGSIVFPLTGYLAMVFEGAYQHAILRQIPVTSATKYKLREVRINCSMSLFEDTATEVSLVIRPLREGSREESTAWYEFSIFSWTQDSSWSKHCQGLVSLVQSDEKSNPIDEARHIGMQRAYHDQLLEENVRLCQTIVDPDDLYSKLRHGGFDFGPAFRNMTAANVAEGLATGVVTIPDIAKLMPQELESSYLIHPCTFDACLQMSSCAASGGDLSKVDIRVPTFVKEMTICHGFPKTPGHRLDVRAKAQSAYGTLDPNVLASISVLETDSTEKTLFEVEGLFLSKLPSQDGDHVPSSERGLCSSMIWEPCLDFLTPDDVTNIFSSTLTEQAPTAQMKNLERAAFHYIKSALDMINMEEVKNLRRMGKDSIDGSNLFSRRQSLKNRLFNRRACSKTMKPKLKSSYMTYKRRT